MASAIVEKIDETHLKCGICLENFRNPRGLPCLHSFCEECLGRWAKVSDKPGVLTCPNCKKETPIPQGGVMEFPADFRVNSLQDTVDSEKQIADLCGLCDPPANPATAHCLDCKEFMCEKCHSAHQKIKALKNHRVVTMEDLHSGAVSKFTPQDQYCTEHDGEEKRFYCETCGKPVCRDCVVLKQCCRDHDTVPIKQASAKQVRYITQSIKTCREKKAECQDALEKSKQVGEQLSSAATKVKDNLDNKKASYLQAIEGIFSTHTSDIDDLCKERTVKLTKDTDSLKTVMKQIDSTLELGVNLTESRSPYDIVSNYTSVLSSLQQVNGIRINEVDDTLADIPTPVVECVLGKEWQQSGEFKVRSDGYPTGIAVSYDGNIALREPYKLHVCSWSGNVKRTIPINKGIGYGYVYVDVAITPNNEYVIPTPINTCQLYNSQYKLISEFKTCNANNKPCAARSVSVDKAGCIILGMRNKAISIHNPDGSVKSRFAIPYVPQSVAATSKQEVVIATDTDNNTLELVDYSGKSILTFDPPPDVNTWKPWYVCCSKRYEVFVANRGDPKAIYKYAAGGVYIGCITTQVGDPWSIALSHDDKELFVTEYRNEMVKIFKRP